MKRLAWLLILAFSTLLAQVPVAEPLVSADRCACGAECGGQCGMPGCLPPAAPTVPQFVVERAVTLVRPAAKRDVLLGERPANRYFAVPLASLQSLPALRPMDRAPSAAGVPLFREHCRLLI
jgi:hypothetical protein